MSHGPKYSAWLKEATQDGRRPNVEYYLQSQIGDPNYREWFFQEVPNVKYISISPPAGTGKHNITHANKYNYAKIRAMETNQFKGGALFLIQPNSSKQIRAHLYDDELNKNQPLPDGEFYINSQRKYPVISFDQKVDKCLNYMSSRDQTRPRSDFNAGCQRQDFYTYDYDKQKRIFDVFNRKN
jgi:hypothetical protein